MSDTPRCDRHEMDVRAFIDQGPNGIEADPVSWPTFARAACIALIRAKRAEKNLDHSNPTPHT